MSGFAVSFISIVLGWLRELFYFIWQIFTFNKDNIFVNLVSNNWIIIVIVLCLIGIFIDWLVYIIRWKPHYVWRGKLVNKHNKKTKQQDVQLPTDDDGEYYSESFNITNDSISIDKNETIDNAENNFIEINGINSYQNIGENHQNNQNYEYGYYINDDEIEDSKKAKNKDYSLIKKLWIELFKDDEYDDETIDIKPDINPEEAFDHSKIK